MKKRLIGLIGRERDPARAGRPARIIAKLNSLVVQEIIETLDEASSAEVAIDLIVRGICCLRPKVPGLGGYIRFICVAGPFLDPRRNYQFRKARDRAVFPPSAS